MGHAATKKLWGNGFLVQTEYRLWLENVKDLIDKRKKHIYRKNSPNSK